MQHKRYEKPPNKQSKGKEKMSMGPRRTLWVRDVRGKRMPTLLCSRVKKLRIRESRSTSNKREYKQNKSRGS